MNERFSLTNVLVWAFGLSQLASMSGVDHIVIGSSQVCIRAKWPISAGAYRGFCSMKRQGIFLLGPRDGMLVHRRVTLSIKFASTHLFTWVERGTVRVKCLAQEHNHMSPTRARTQTVRSVAP